MVSLCIKDNNEKVQNYLMQKIGESNIPDIYYSKHIFKVYENVIIHYKGKNFKRFYNYLSSILSDAIVNYYEPLIVKRLIDGHMSVVIALKNIIINVLLLSINILPKRLKIMQILT